MKRHVCIHAHFYQPPRENPWLEEIEIQDSAYPYHDWNERIAAECYGPNGASRILDPARRVIDIVNNYTKISFNFGPTLLSWLERHAPETYAAVLDADRLSRERFSGHGSAIAQVYNHVIMPLANDRDRQTQVFWGVRDFEHRFGRSPEGMWLAETAADVATLEELARHSIRFTVLAPNQARRVRPLAGGDWQDVSDSRVDPRVPYLCKLPSGRSICLFFYEGPIARGIAFAGLLTDGTAFAERLEAAFSPEPEEPELVHIATDGESYGHHHHSGDMALAYCLYRLESEELAEITVYGEFLDRYPPVQEVEIWEQSSWSCVHGVERWRSNCGCNSGGRPDWNQEWRAPLREALDWLRDELAPLYERELSGLLEDPWAARDDYIDVILDRSPQRVEAFLSRRVKQPLAEPDKVRALQLLEMQRHALLMYTSCGWFFDEVSGIETVQIIQYAARALQLARDVTGLDLEPAFVERLGRAKSNLPDVVDGAHAYERYVKPAAIDLLRVGAHYAVSSIFEDHEETTRVFAYTARCQAHDKQVSGWRSLSTGRVRLRSDVTWEEGEVTYAVLHLGDHNVNGGVRSFLGDEAFADMQREVTEAFSLGDVPQVIRLMDRHFGMDNYNLWHLFRDEQRKALEQLQRNALQEVDAALQGVYENNHSLMVFLRSLGVPLRKEFRVVAEHNLAVELSELLRDPEMEASRLAAAIHRAREFAIDLPPETAQVAARPWVEAQVDALLEVPEDVQRMARFSDVLGVLQEAGLEPELWRAQNGYFRLGRQLLAPMRRRGAGGDLSAVAWMEAFSRLGAHLRVTVDG
jgi:alpha-amylase/alpha-mannosidase (GH57 family)